MKIFNQKQSKQRRQRLRREATPAEMELWDFLKEKQLNGLKFRRQHGIGPYIVDFYCPALKLAIELDGDIHDLEPMHASDRYRQAYIEKLGIKVLRFSNDDVLRDIDLVLKEIRKQVS